MKQSPLLQLDSPQGFIASDEKLLTGQAGTCQLFGAFSGSTLSFMLREKATGKILASELLLNNGTDAYPDFLRQAISQSELVGLRAHQSATLSVFNPYTTLIPSSLFKSGDEKSYLRLAVERDDLLPAYQPVSGFGLHVIFGLVPEMDSLIRQLLPGCTVKHGLAGLLEYQWMATGASKSTQALCVIHPELLTVIINSGRSLILANHFPIRDYEEAAYYFLNVCDQCELDRQQLPVTLAGIPHAVTAVTARWSAYFSQLESLPAVRGAALSYKLKELPAGALLSAYSVSLCES